MTSCGFLSSFSSLPTNIEVKLTYLSIDLHIFLYCSLCLNTNLIVLQLYKTKRLDSVYSLTICMYIYICIQFEYIYIYR